MQPTHMKSQVQWSCFNTSESCFPSSEALEHSTSMQISQPRFELLLCTVTKVLANMFICYCRASCTTECCYSSDHYCQGRPTHIPTKIILFLIVTECFLCIAAFSELTNVTFCFVNKLFLHSLRCPNFPCRPGWPRTQEICSLLPPTYWN